MRNLKALKCAKIRDLNALKYTRIRDFNSLRYAKLLIYLQIPFCPLTDKKSLRWWDTENCCDSETMKITQMVTHKKSLRWWDIWNYWDGETWKIAEMVKHWESPRWWDITVCGHHGICRLFSSLIYLNTLKSFILIYFNM